MFSAQKNSSSFPFTAAAMAGADIEPLHPEGFL
jgi:hypothetical protein